MSVGQGRKVLITGANRGLGLEFAKQYTRDGYEVLAVIRGEPSAELKALKAQTFCCDLSDPRNIPELKSKLGDEPLDIVINNAGIMAKSNPVAKMTDQDCDAFVSSFTVNVISPLRLAGALVENLRAKKDGLKVMAFLTSKMGSISDNASGGSYPYRASKTALNSAVTSLKFEIPDVTTLLLHPGWVRTEMGGSNGQIEAPESVTGLRKIIAEEKRSGVFIDYKGVEIPW